MTSGDSDQRTSSDSRRRAAAIATVLIAVTAHASLVCMHFAHLWSRPHYRFVFPSLPLAAWLIWRRWPRNEPYVRSRRVERVLLGGSVILLSAAEAIHSPYLAAVSAVLAVGLAMAMRAGARGIATLLAPWALLWLAVPPPLGYDLILISKLQALTSKLASLLLDLIGIPHLMSGNVLQLRDVQLFVDEACSGVHSAFALFGYTAVFVVFSSRSLRRSVLLLAGTFVWAILGNLLRVTAIAVARSWWQLDLSSGWPHQMLGLFTFLIALVMTLSTDRLLHFAGYCCVRLVAFVRRQVASARRAWPLPSVRLTRPDPCEPYRPQRRTVDSPRRSPAFTVTAMLAYTVLFVGHVAGLSRGGSTNWTENPLGAMAPDFMPPTLNSLAHVKFERVQRIVTSDFGSTSLVWTYGSSSREEIRVSLDGSFPGWHELTRCYEGQGWHIDQRRLAHDAEFDWVEAALSRPTGERACVAFSLASVDGRPLRPSAGVSNTRILDRLSDVQTIQVQAFAETSGSVDGQLGEDVRRAFRVAMSRWCDTRRRSTSADGNRGASRG